MTHYLRPVTRLGSGRPGNAPRRPPADRHCVWDATGRRPRRLQRVLADFLVSLASPRISPTVCSHPSLSVSLSCPIPTSTLSFLLRLVPCQQNLLLSYLTTPVSPGTVRCCFSGRHGRIADNPCTPPDAVGAGGTPDSGRGAEVSGSSAPRPALLSYLPPPPGARYRHHHRLPVISVISRGGHR